MRDVMVQEGLPEEEAARHFWGLGSRGLLHTTGPMRPFQERYARPSEELSSWVVAETGHYDLVAGECAAGLQRVQLDTGRPVVFGVLTTENDQQALERSSDEDNKGHEAVETAKEFCGADAPGFVNGILAAALREMQDNGARNG